MKIGVFTDTYFPQVNGVTYTIDLWRRELEKRGHEVYIHYPRSEHEPGDREYAYRSVEFKFYKDYRVAMPLSIRDRTKGLDVVHIHGLFSMAIAGLIASQRHGLPKVLTYHTPADEYIDYITQNPSLKKTFMKIYNLWERKLLNSCDIVTCPCSVVRDRLIAKGVKDVTVLSNGVDLNFFKPVDSKRFKEKHGIEEDTRVIGFCGRFGFEKHLEELINIADDFEGLILLAGRGPAEEHYRKLAENKKNIKFLGFLPRQELLEFYSTLDVFVFPSKAETQGLVALESMACGIPVVGANELALKDTIIDGYNGHLYNFGDRKQLLQKIEETYTERKKLSQNCLEYVKQHSIEKTIDKLLTLYHKAIENKKIK